jgi:unsaturated rhamnogalacturonyl hydrolase
MKSFKSVVILLACSFFTSTVLAAKKNNNNDYLQWAITIANSEIKHNPELWQADFVKKPKWGYTQGLIAYSMTKLYLTTKDSSYFNYVKKFADLFINNKGEILTYTLDKYNIDNINGGKFLFDMYNITNEEKYLKALQLLRTQIEKHPRTKIGVFWHKKIYENQVWLDGLYMGAPFYAQCVKELKEPVANYNDVAKQLILGDSVTLDRTTGLNFHAWDESRLQKWSNPETGHSPHFWGRSMGWYMMAMVDVLDFLPKNHPQRKQIIANLNRLTKALANYQDKQTGMWYQVTDLGGKEGNYVESSCTAMYIYAIAKGINKKYLDKDFKTVVQKAYCGMIANATQVNEDGTTSITKACSVAGLGGNPYRDGSYEYYIREPIRNDDPKVIGPFILASLEMNKLCKK